MTAAPESRERKKAEKCGVSIVSLASAPRKATPHYLPDFATLSAQSTRHGARPGPKLAPSVQVRPLLARQPRAREAAHGRRRKAWKCRKETHLYIVMCCTRCLLGFSAALAAERDFIIRFLSVHPEVSLGLLPRCCYLCWAHTYPCYETLRESARTISQMLRCYKCNVLSYSLLFAPATGGGSETKSSSGSGSSSSGSGSSSCTNMSRILELQWLGM